MLLTSALMGLVFMRSGTGRYLPAERYSTEVAVDDTLHAQAFNELIKDCRAPRVLQIVTGDGNDNHGRASFPEHVESALLQGWHVELHTWRCSTSATYRRFAREYGGSGRFKIHYLDELRL